MGSLSRRTLFSAGLGIAAVGVPANARGVGDEHLIELGHRYAALIEAYEAAGRAEDEAQARFDAVHVSKPVAYATQEDIDRGVGGASLLKVGQRIPWSEIERVNKSRASEWMRRAADSGDARWVWSEKYASLMDQYQFAVNEAEERVGLTAAGNHARLVYRELCDLEEAIVTAPCSTIAGLRIKAQVAKRLVPPVDDVENDWKDTAALSVIDVVLKMGSH